MGSGDGHGQKALAYPEYVLLPGSSRRDRSRRSCLLWSACKFLSVAFLLASGAAAGFLLFPRQPLIEVTKVTLSKIAMHTEDQESVVPAVMLDVSLSLQLRITNYNFFGVNCEKVRMRFFYRADNLGEVDSYGGKVPARSVAMAAARLDLEGTPLLEHATDLASDVASREVPIQTETHFTGSVEIFAFRPNIDVKVYCSIVADPVDNEVLSQDCSLTPFN